MKVASPVLNGEVEETGHKALRLDLTQRSGSVRNIRTETGLAHTPLVAVRLELLAHSLLSPVVEHE